MSVRSDESNPHQIWCILQRFKQCIETDAPYSVSCNRDDCWSDLEANKWRCAVNLRLESERFGDQMPIGKSKIGKAQQCAYINTLSIEVQIYTLGCDDESLYEALECLKQIEDRLCECKPTKRRIDPTFTNFTTSNEGERELTAIVRNYDIEYALCAC